MSIPSQIPNIPKIASEAITMVTDPYHDYNLQISGYPDGTLLVSAVQRTAGRVDIKCPFVLAVGESWDFHVFTTELHADTKLTTGTFSSASSTVTVLASPTYEQVGPVNVLYRKYSGLGVVNGSVLVALSGLPLTGDMNQRRTISLGFEIHNTTAELYKSGSLTVYRQPVMEGYCDPTINIGGSYSYHHCKLLNQIPTDLDDIQRIPNTRTWEASEGAYCVCLPYFTNNISSIIRENVLIRAGISNNSVLLRGHIATVPVSPFTFSPLSCAGVMSSRFMNTEQTFILDYRQVIETVPSSDDISMMSFTTNAPPVDRVFLKLYKRMFNHIPPGVPVHFNSAGDWFRSIISIAKDMLPGIAAALPGQVKPLGMAAVPLLTGLIDKALDKKVAQISPPPVLNTTQRVVLPAQLRKKLLSKIKVAPGVRRKLLTKRKTK